MNPENDPRKTTSPRKTEPTAYNTTMPKRQSYQNISRKRAAKKQKRHVLVVMPVFTGTPVKEPTTSDRNQRETDLAEPGVNFTPQRNFKAAEDEYHRRRAMETEGKTLMPRHQQQAKPARKKESPRRQRPSGK